VFATFFCGALFDGKIVAKLNTTLLWPRNFGQRRKIPNGISAETFKTDKADLDFPKPTKQ